MTSRSSLFVKDSEIPRVRKPFRNLFSGDGVERERGKRFPSVSGGVSIRNPPITETFGSLALPAPALKIFSVEPLYGNLSERECRNVYV